VTTAIDKVNGAAVASAEPRFDPRALAEAEAIRTRAEAEAEAARIKAEGEAKAAEVLAAEEAAKLRLANERSAMRLERERAEHDAKVAKLNRDREEAERQAAEAREKAAAEANAEAARREETEAADAKWRTYALGFYIVCAVVALPVQINAFWNLAAPWLVVAPLMLEGGAAVVLKGAAAAVAAHRPHWHYRLIAWVLAFIAAGINLWHGLEAFDPATAIGTAFASLAGPGVWDLHENGRIRKRDGKPTWRQRGAQRAAEKKAAAEKAANEARQHAEKEASEKAAAEAAESLAKDRAEKYADEWAHALKLAAALGETTVTEAVWKRAYKDINGVDPGESVDIIRTRNAAARRVEAARSEAPGNTPSKVTNAQRAIQMNTPARRSSYRPVPPRRKAGDTPGYHPAARSAAAEAKRKSNAAKNATTDDASS
jgi:hypothetical protein